MENPLETVLEAALPHVPFDGWSETTLAAAISDSGVPGAVARALFPRGGADLSVRVAVERFVDNVDEPRLPL